MPIGIGYGLENGFKPGAGRPVPTDQHVRIGAGADRQSADPRETSDQPVRIHPCILSLEPSVYRRPAKIGEEDCTIMALIDRQYLARPYYGSRRMAAWLATQGRVVTANGFGV